MRPDRPYGITVAGTELVAWRDAAGGLRVGPGACPHLGAPLSTAAVDCGELVCRWHGLRVGGRDSAGRGGAGWRSLPAYDDGVLAWVRLDRAGGEPPLDAPAVPARPVLARSLSAVATLIGVCEPEDIVANRLDPWHGAWFHPYFFSRLSVLSAPAEVTTDEEDDRFTVAVTFRVSPRLGVPVRAELSCPGPRTVVMAITEGEGPAAWSRPTPPRSAAGPTDSRGPRSSRPWWRIPAAPGSPWPGGPRPRCAR